VGSVFPGPRLFAAIIGRITFNAHILETGTQPMTVSILGAATTASASSL
jgi:hypothetical protein